MQENNKIVFWDAFNLAFVVYHGEFSWIAFPEESLWGLCKSIWTSVGVVQHRFECFVDRFGTTRKILQCSLGTFGSRFQHLGTCCRLLWHHPKNASVRFWKIRKSSTSELVVDCFCVCEHSAKARAKGLRSARTDIVVFLAFISKSRSGGCPAAQGLEMKAIFTSRIFKKRK